MDAVKWASLGAALKKQRGFSKDLFIYEYFRKVFTQKAATWGYYAQHCLDADRSLVIGLNPRSQERMTLSLQKFAEFFREDKDFNLERAFENLIHFILGYENGIEGAPNLQKTQPYRELVFNIHHHQFGFFDHTIPTYFPRELALLRRTCVMGSLCDHPQAFLKERTENLASEYIGTAFALPLTLDEVRGLIPEGRVYLVYDQYGGDGGKQVLRKVPFVDATDLVLKGIFVLSKSRDQAVGNYGVVSDHIIDGAPNRKDVPTSERNHPFSFASTPLSDKRVNGHNEAATLDASFDAEGGKITGLPPIQEYLLRASAVSTTPNFKKKIGYEPAWQTIPDTLHLIYQAITLFPDFLSRENVQETLFLRLYQKDVLETALEENPEFFVYVGPLLKKILPLFDEHAYHHAVKLLLHDFSERIRRHSFVLVRRGVMTPQKAQEIAASLPRPDTSIVLDLFHRHIQDRYQRMAASFLLSYASLWEDEIDEKEVILAFAIFKRSAVAVPMPQVVLSEIHRFYQETFLVSLTTPLPDKLLFELSRKNEGEWKSVTPFEYHLYHQDKLIHTINLQTGSGVEFAFVNESWGSLPILIKEHPDYKLLFGDYDPTVVTTQGNPPTTTCYSWKDAETHITYSILFDLKTDNLQIFQEFRREKKVERYRFCNLDIVQNPLGGLPSTTVSSFVQSKISKSGVWFGEKDGVLDTKKAFLIQHKTLKEEPIVLHMTDRRIQEATIGTGNDRLWVLSELKSKDQPLLSSQGLGRLLLLSRDKERVDEIRFVDSRGRVLNELTLRRNQEDPSIWEIGARPHLRWELKETAWLEAMFGTDYREFIIPFRNVSGEGDEWEIWTLTYPVVSKLKANANPNFIKTFKGLGLALQEVGALAPDSFIGKHVLDALKKIPNQARIEIGEEEILRFFALLDQVSGSHFQVSKVAASEFQHELKKEVGDLIVEARRQFQWFEPFLGPIPTRISFTLSKGEKGSHAAFLYLAYVCYKKGNLAEGARYLNLMVERGDTNPNSTAMHLTQSEKEAEIEKELMHFKSLVMMILTFEMLQQGRMPFQTREEISFESSAFLLKLLISLKRVEALISARLRGQLYELGEVVIKGIGTISSLNLLRSAATRYQNATLEQKNRLREIGLLLDEEERLLPAIYPHIRLKAQNHSLQLSRIPKQEPLEPLSFSIPEAAELATLWPLLRDLNDPSPPISILALHAQKKKPSWETVLSQFWSYFEWILIKQPSLADLSFLFEEIPPSAKFRKGVDVARRLLLAVYFCKTKNPDSWRENFQGILLLFQDIQKRQKELPNFAEMQKKWLALRSDAEQENVAWELFKSVAFGWHLWHERNKVDYDLTFLGSLEFATRGQVYGDEGRLKQVSVGGVPEIPAGSAQLYLEDCRILFEKFLLKPLQDLGAASMTPRGLIDPKPEPIALQKDDEKEPPPPPELPEEKYPVRLLTLPEGAFSPPLAPPDQNWDPYFVPIEEGTWKAHWEGIVRSAENYFPERAPNTATLHSNKTIRKGVEKALAEMKKKLKYCLNITHIQSLQKKVSERIAQVTQECTALKKAIFSHATIHIDSLNLRPFFARSMHLNQIEKKRLFEHLVDLYLQGKLKGKLQSLIQQFLFAKTENDQLSFAAKTASRMLNNLDQLSVGKDIETLKQEVLASTTWRNDSFTLHYHLEQGCNRQRYDAINDPDLTRAYLVTDYRHRQISRVRALDAIEEIVVNGKKFIILRMGVGKSTFIFPVLTRHLIKKGSEPVVVTPPELVLQLKGFMDAKAFLFEFSIDYGLIRNPGEAGEVFNKRIIGHLEELVAALKLLKVDGRYVITTPVSLASIRNKCTELTRALEISDEASKGQLSKELALVEELHRHFFGRKEVIFLGDEDLVRQVFVEFNFAIGQFARTDPIFYLAAERFTLALFDDPVMRARIANNTLRTINPQNDLKPIARKILEDEAFWKKAGFEKSFAGREDLVDYLLDSNREPPNDLHEQIDGEPTPALKHLLALRKIMSTTFKAVYKTQMKEKLERGFKSGDKCSVGPRADGKEKPMHQFGEREENMLHHLFHYAAFAIEQNLFVSIYKTLSTTDKETPLGSVGKETGQDLVDLIAQMPITEKKGEMPQYTAFKDKASHRARIYFLRYLFFRREELRYYPEQIVLNNLNVTEDIILLSGTGNAASCGLADVNGEDDADMTFGETILALSQTQEGGVAGLDRPVEEIKSLRDFIISKAMDHNCQAIINEGFEIFGNDVEKLARFIRRIPHFNRQLVFRSGGERFIWNRGDEAPIQYHPDLVTPTTLFLYGPSDSRGVDFLIPKTPQGYGTVLVDSSTTADRLNQAIWRMRELGTGHHGRIAIDAKMRAYIQETYAQKLDTVTIGHVLYTVKQTALKKDELYNVKALICQVKSIIRNKIEHLRVKPFNSKNPAFDEFKVLLLKVHERLFFSKHQINWQALYNRQGKLSREMFIRGLYFDQLKRLVRFRKDFEKASAEFMTKLKGSQTTTQSWFGAAASFMPGIFETIASAASGNPVTVELESRIAETLQIYESCKQELEKGLDDLKDPKMIAFYKRTIPDEVDASALENSGHEQQVQSQQQVQQQIELHQLSQPQRRGGAYEEMPIDYEAFKLKTPGSYTYRKKSGDDIFMSEKAERLTSMCNCKDWPITRLLVVRDAKKQYHSCIVTQTDCEQSIDPGIKEDRTKNDRIVAVFAWNHRGDFGPMILNSNHYAEAYGFLEDHAFKRLIINNKVTCGILRYSPEEWKIIEERAASEKLQGNYDKWLANFKHPLLIQLVGARMKAKDAHNSNYQTQQPAAKGHYSVEPDGRQNQQIAPPPQADEKKYAFRDQAAAKSPDQP